MSQLPNPLEEKDLVDAADIVYSEGYTGENKHHYEQALDHPRIKNFEDTLVAGTSYEWVEDVIQQLDGTIEVLPISLAEEYRRLEDIGLKIEAHNLLVAVRARQVLSLNDYIDRSSDPWIMHMPYSEKLGLDLSMRDYSKHSSSNNVI